MTTSRRSFLAAVLALPLAAVSGLRWKWTPLNHLAERLMSLHIQNLERTLYPLMEVSHEMVTVDDLGDDSCIRLDRGAGGQAAKRQAGAVPDAHPCTYFDADAYPQSYPHGDPDTGA